MLGPPAAPVVQRKATTAKAAALTRLATEFGITVVREGTVADQARRVAGVPRLLSAEQAREQLVAAGWEGWSPPEKSAMWTSMADGIARFAAAAGGLPAVDEVIFLKQDFDNDPTSGKLVPRPDVGASYSAGSLLVFAKGAAGRFVAAGRRDAGAQSNTTRGDLGYEMTHELGHGLVEKAMAADPSVVGRFRTAVGWVGDRLHDIGRAEVREAVAAGRTPPAASRITASNWESADLAEQPMSAYMVTSPSEDLAETVAAHVNRPDVLKARSPHRARFVATLVAGNRT